MLNLTEYLEQYCDELTPREFYRLIFPSGELDADGAFTKGKYTAVGVAINPERCKRYTITDDLNGLDHLLSSDDFCIISPISYAGKTRKSEYARYLYAIAIDVDGIKMREFVKEGAPIGIVDLFYQFDGHGPSNYLPKPTAIVSSGTGLHIYYVFERAIPLYQNIVKQLDILKRRLTWQLWTQGVTDLADNVQYESLFQGFRVPGTKTKVGTKVRAFLVDSGEKVTIEYLNKFVPEEYRVTDIAYKSSLTLAESKEKYPEWYQERIVEGKKRRTWVANEALYKWWIRKIISGAAEGHRYWCILALAAYAKKCDVDRETLEEDCLSLLPYLDSMTNDENNHFTEDDILKALEAYNDSYITYPIHTISARCDIPIRRNKRNGRKQEVHLMGARAIQEINDRVNGTNWRKENGRPIGSGTAQQRVQQWRSDHPDGSKSQCKSDTGLSYPTIRKWWEDGEKN